MDEEIIKKLREVDGCNICENCPIASFEDSEDWHCNLFEEKIEIIYLEKSCILYYPECDLEIIKRTGGDDFIPEKINAQELINTYIKSNL